MGADPDHRRDSMRTGLMAGRFRQGGGLNLGCGTLIVLFVLVATAGKFLPHGSRETESQRHDPPATQASKPQADRSAVRPAPLAATVSAPPVPREPAKNNPRPAPDNQGGLADFEALVSSLALELGKLIDAGTAPAAEGIQHPVRKEAPSNRVSTPVESPVRTSPSGQVPAPRLPASALTSAGPAGSGSGSLTRPVPESPMGVDASPEAVARPGKEAVFNSPWDQSVEQVDRYLRRHTHDAASMEVLEWGKVLVTPQGYQVRCSFRSKNVLGKLATQSKLFVLDKRGEVTDIRD